MLTHTPIEGFSPARMPSGGLASAADWKKRWRRGRGSWDVMAWARRVSPGADALKRFAAWAVGGVLLSLALDEVVRWYFPLPGHWLDNMIHGGVSLSLMVGAWMWLRGYARRQDAVLRRQHARNWYVAWRDPLTRADNRQALIERIDCLSRPEQPVGARAGLLVLDLQDFQRINDACGHAVGDMVLREASRRLRRVLLRELRQMAAGSSATDIARPRLVRIGSDELALWLPCLPDMPYAVAVARDMLSELEQPLEVAGLKLHLKACVGVVCERMGELSGNDWLTRASAATAEAKRLGVGSVASYSLELHHSMIRRYAIQYELQQALCAKSGLSLHYQPIVSAQSARLMGCEALLRWQHGQWGAVSPAEFVPIAESSDLIHPLGEWVLDTALTQLAQWRQANPALAGSGFTLSVNLSRAQLLNPRLQQQISAGLDRYGLEPGALRLEVTESLPLDDVQTLQALERLRALGVSLALDDFGTGYSSLSALLKLPMQSVKIDRQFVNGIDACPYRQALMAGVVRLADAMGLDTVAEGVERPEEVEALRRLGCQRLQGWHVGRPAGADAFARQWLSGHLPPAAEGVRLHAVPAGKRPGAPSSAEPQRPHLSTRPVLIHAN